MPRATLTLTVHVIVDTDTLLLTLDNQDDRLPSEVVADEVQSNLESVPYVHGVEVKQGDDNDSQVHSERQGRSRRQAG